MSRLIFAMLSLATVLAATSVQAQTYDPESSRLHARLWRFGGRTDRLHLHLTRAVRSHGLGPFSDMPDQSVFRPPLRPTQTLM